MTAALQFYHFTSSLRCQGALQNKIVFGPSDVAARRVLALRTGYNQAACSFQCERCRFRFSLKWPHAGLLDPRLVQTQVLCLTQ